MTEQSLRDMRDECIKYDNCAGCKYTEVCFNMKDNIDPFDWTDEDIARIVKEEL